MLFRKSGSKKYLCIYSKSNLSESQSKCQIYIYIYIYAFSRRFYPKRLTLHSSYSFTLYQLLYQLSSAFIKSSEEI